MFFPISEKFKLIRSPNLSIHVVKKKDILHGLDLKVKKMKRPISAIFECVREIARNSIVSIVLVL